MAKKRQIMGDVLLEHEKVMLKMVEDGLQWGDIFNITKGYLEVHCPGAREEYVAGGHPIFYYGPESETKTKGDNMNRVVHTFKKRPGAKYLAKRRVSFSATGEVEHVRDEDKVNIVISTPSGETNVELTGKEFLRKLQDRTVKTTGKKIFILEF